jgi:arginase
MLHFIVAPYHLGQKAVAVGAGPVQVQGTDIVDRIGATVSQIDIGASAHWTDVNRRIADEVRHVLHRGAFPIVLAGNCHSCLGTLAGIGEARLGIVWFDAHGDFHTPETSLSGSLEGMSLTLATTEFVAEQRVVLIGARDLDPGEDDRVRGRLLHLPHADLRSHQLPEADAVYVHIDMDVLDPAISPGVNFQGPGGLTVESLVDALTFTFDSYTVAALAIVNYNPSCDIEHRTRDVIVLLIEEIARLRKAVATR